jgi:hypothetical protein
VFVCLFFFFSGKGGLRSSPELMGFRRVLFRFNKKTILLIGLFILSLSTILTSCDDDDETVILTNNVIAIGDAISPITSVSSKTENDDTFIIINTDAMELIFEFNDKQSIPTGTFDITFNGNYNGARSKNADPFQVKQNGPQTHEPHLEDAPQKRTNIVERCVPK